MLIGQCTRNMSLMSSGEEQNECWRVKCALLAKLNLLFGLFVYRMFISSTNAYAGCGRFTKFY